jgi:hypothetical protein
MSILGFVNQLLQKSYSMIMIMIYIYIYPLIFQTINFDLGFIKNNINLIKFLIFEVVMAVMKNTIFWDIMLCNVV